jgi:hypothetical protein
MLKKEPLLKKKFYGIRNTVPVKVMKAYVVHRSSVDVARTLSR